MTKVLTDEQNYYDIADAIRGKLEVETLYLPSEMAAAIETIETGTELTSEDEGKVVIEDEGAYILTEQTSQTITVNGTYDTTTVNELIANIGYGNAKNILNGNSVPSSSIGSNGDIYLYLGSNIVTMQAYNITDIGINIINGVVTIVGTTAGVDTSDGRTSGVILKTGVNAVRISVTPYQNGVQYGTCFSSASLPTVVTSGSGRKSYSTDTSGYDFSKNTDDYYFACAYDNGVGNEVRIGITSNDQSQQFDADATSIHNVYLKVNGSWVLIEGQDIGDVNANANLIEKTVTSNGTYDPTDDDAEGYSLVTVDVPQSGGGGSQGGGTIITIYDNPTNATGDLMSGDVLYNPDTSGASFVFLFSDNQQTGFTIGGKTYSYNDTVIGTGWNSDNVNAILDELDDSDSLNVAWGGGDGGNHAGTLIVINKSFGTSYKQTMFQSNSASQTIGTTMSEAYVLLLFCVYGGSATANITFMGESIAVQRYATRYSNSIYAYVSKLENLSAGSVVGVSVDGASSSSVIGIMGIFGD